MTKVIEAIKAIEGKAIALQKENNELRERIRVLQAIANALN